MKRWGIIALVAIYIIGAGLTAWYAFGSNYLAYPDAVREYQLYNMMQYDDYWSVHNYVTANFNEFDLQVSCLFTTLIPARLWQAFPIDAELFYKLYMVVLLPLFPVFVYALARKFTGMLNSIIAALFLMGWVSFLQEGSNARTGIALVFYSAALLLVFSPSMNRYLRYGLLAMAAACMPLAHYTTSVLGAAIVGGVLLLTFGMSKHGWGYRRPIVAFFIPLVLATAAWSFWGSNALLPKAGEEFAGYVPFNEQAWQPDMISRYALGLSSPNPYAFILLAIAWGTVAVTAYGLFVGMKSSGLPAEMKALGVVSFAVCAVFLVIVPLSRVYNADRVYLQALTVLGLFFILGVEKVAAKVRIPPFTLGLPLVLVYGGLMKYFCLQYAIVENM